MADRATIHARPRQTFGKKVKRLRKQGILPANIYGRGLESLAIQVDNLAFFHTIRNAGVRSMFELAVEGENEPRFVLIRALSRYGGTGDFIHADFYQVDLNRPITTNVTIAFSGESPAVRDLNGTLLTMIDTVSVRCLPLDIPANFEVDLAQLNSFDVTVTAGDLPIPAGVDLLTDESVPVVTINPPRLRLRDAEIEDEEGEEGEEGAEDEDTEGGESSDDESSE